MFKYAIRLHKFPSGSLLKAAYSGNDDMDTNGIKCWYSQFKQIIQGITDKSIEEVYSMSSLETNVC